MKNIKYIVASTLFLFLFAIVFNRPIAAAVEKVTSVFVTNWPQVFKTQEQNLDANGSIKVHEQGIVDVNINNTEPLDVELVNPGSQPGTKIITVFDNISMLDNTPKTSDFIDIDGYKKIALYAQKPVSNSLVNIYAKFSVDGITEFSGSPALEMILDGNNHSVYQLIDVPGPKVRISTIPSVSPPTNLTVKLYLIP